MTACDSATVPRSSLGRSVPCPPARDAARGSERARLRAAELAKTRSWSAGTGSTLVGGLVHRLADGGDGRLPCCARDGGANVAGAGRLEAARTRRQRRGAAARPL